MGLRQILLGGGSGSASGFIASVVRSGIAFSNQFRLLGGSASAGIESEARFLSAITSQHPSFFSSLLGISGSAARPVVSSGIQQASRISDYTARESPSFEIQSVSYSLNRRVGGATQSAVGTAWTNPANALGIHDTTVATVAGSAAGSTNGIELSYADATNKNELTITGANLHVYAEVTGDATGLRSTFVISYNIGSGVTQLESIQGNFSNLTVPRTYSLPLLDSWTEYNALQARVVETMALASAGITARLDAIEIEIIASRTDTL